jgi:hypothetical protein
MLEFDGTGFVTDVVYDRSSLPRDRWSTDKVKILCCRFYGSISVMYKTNFKLLYSSITLTLKIDKNVIQDLAEISSIAQDGRHCPCVPYLKRTERQ